MKYYIYLFLILISNSIILANEIKYVSKITFTGNAEINDAELRPVTKLQEPKYFSRINKQ